MEWMGASWVNGGWTPCIENDQGEREVSQNFGGGDKYYWYGCQMNHVSPNQMNETLTLIVNSKNESCLLHVGGGDTEKCWMSTKSRRMYSSIPI